eukprot:scaffold206973_cov17-Tisochrysis_lutea.AAC.1
MEGGKFSHRLPCFLKCAWRGRSKIISTVSFPASVSSQPKIANVVCMNLRQNTQVCLARRVYKVSEECPEAMLATIWG